jgi:hypothetical protein
MLPSPPALVNRIARFLRFSAPVHFTQSEPRILIAMFFASGAGPLGESIYRAPA